MLAAAALPLLTAVPASAGTYKVYVCKTPTGQIAPTDGWSAEQVGSGGSTANGCATGGSLSAWLRSDATVGAGTRAGWGVTAAPNTAIAAVELWHWETTNRGLVSSTSTPSAYIAFPGAEYTDRVQRCTGSEWCTAVGTRSDAVRPENYWSSGDLLGTLTAHFAVGCIGTSTCEQGGGPLLAVHEVQAMRLTVRDLIAPEAADVRGSFTDAGAHRGVASLLFNATDDGGGLYRTYVDIRPAGADDFTTPVEQIVDPNNGRCAELDAAANTEWEFGYRAPCRLNVTEDVAFDTAAFPDGQYEVRVRIEDAAANETVVVPTRAFEIDNIPPPALEPGTLVVTGSRRTDEVLSAQRGTWTGADITYAYRWLRCTSETDLATCSAVAGATTTQLALEEADLGRYLRVEVSATNVQGTTTAVSDAVGPVTLPSGEIPECADGLDNDADGATDEDDSDCTGRADPRERVDVAVTPSPSPTPTTTPGGGTAEPASGPKGTPTPAPQGGQNQAQANGHNASSHARLTVRGSARRTLRFGSRSSASIELLDEEGRPISGARLYVLERINVQGASFQVTPTVLRTDTDGRARLAIRRGPGRTIRLAYRARLTGSDYDAVADIETSVQSKTSIRKSRSFLLNGQTLRFSGRILSRPVPRDGVGIDLQAQVGNRWQTFKTIKTTGDGRWHARYTFRSTTGLQTYRFRARVRGDSGFPYTPSTSKRVTVRVRG